MSEKKLSIGDKVKITDGPNAGKEGYITKIDIDGAIEVRGLEGAGKYYTSRQFAFQLEKINPEKGAETITYNERVCDDCNVKSRTVTVDGNNPIKDSGQRTVFPSGARRDMSQGKGLMVVMPWPAILRVSRHYENGARKYGFYNYQKGIPTSSFADSAMRHMAEYLSGRDDEDHLSAAIFNLLGIALMEEEHPDMCDIPSRVGKKTFKYFEDKDDEQK